MAAYWTDVAPALPTGAAWSDPVNTNTEDTNLAFYYATCRIARLNRSQVVVKADIYAKRRVSYAISIQVWMSGKDPEGTEVESSHYNTPDLPDPVTHPYFVLCKTLYFICDAAPNETVSLRLQGGYWTNYAVLTAPAYLLPEIKAKVNGEAVNISDVYVNVGGVAVPVDSIKFNGG